MINVKVYKINKDVQRPEYATEGSSCFDIRADLTNHNKVKGYLPSNISHDIQPMLNKSNNKMAMVLTGNCRALIPTGLIFDIPDGYSMRIHPRSGLAIKFGINLINCEGVIDSDYVNEIFIPLINNSVSLYTINHGDRIAQCEIVKTEKVSYIETLNKPTKTTRNGGFGSTGK